MWEDTLTKVQRLLELDNQLQVFGAERHRYYLADPVEGLTLALAERRLRAILPDELRKFYLNWGDGVVGPHYGLRQIAEVEGYRPSEDYTDAATLRARVHENGQANESDEYFEIERGELTGLIAIIDEGCGTETCLVTNGPREGEVVSVSAEGYVHETGRTLIQSYEQWVDRELAKFEMVRNLMDSGALLDEINQEFREKFESYDAENIIVSIADVQKPAALFGSGGSRIYHGATQTPWYENVLRVWRESGTNTDS
jgi:hypothetical protein